MCQSAGINHYAGNQRYNKMIILYAAVERCGNPQNDVEYFHTRRLFDAVQMQFVVERLAIDPQ